MRLQRKIRSIICRYNDKRFAVHLLKWMIICIGIAVVAALVLPITIFLAALTGMLILIRSIDKRRKKKIPMRKDNKIADVFDVISPIDECYYYCMYRGTKHKETACPSCGSKFKKTVES